MLPDNAFWIGLCESEGSSCSDRGTAPSQRGGCHSSAISPGLPDAGKRADLPQNARISASPQPHHQQDARGKLKALGHQPAGLGLLLTLLGTEGLSRGFPNSALLAGEI